MAIAGLGTSQVEIAGQFSASIGSVTPGLRCVIKGHIIKSTDHRDKRRAEGVGMARLDDVRAAIRAQDQAWEAGATRIGETYESGRFHGLGFAPKGRELGGGRGKLSQQSFAFQGAAPPRYVDWRDVNGDDWITSVRDQGQCGSCVSFATCAVLESRTKIRLADPHHTVQLSVAHLFFCGAGDSGCEDGWQIGSALKRCRDTGVGKEDDFRYKPRNARCKEIDPVVRVERWRRISKNDERKQALYQRGPVIGAMVVYSDILWYRGGVYRPTTTETIGLHAIAVIGYDDEKGCWLVKNSWGAAWGEGGFARIGYGTCGVDAQFEFYDPQVMFVG